MKKIALIYGAVALSISLYLSFYIVFAFIADRLHSSANFDTPAARLYKVEQQKLVSQLEQLKQERDLEISKPFQDVNKVERLFEEIDELQTELADQRTKALNDPNTIEFRSTELKGLNYYIGIAVVFSLLIGIIVTLLFRKKPSTTNQ